MPDWHKMTNVLDCRFASMWGHLGIYIYTSTLEIPMQVV